MIVKQSVSLFLILFFIPFFVEGYDSEKKQYEKKNVDLPTYSHNWEDKKFHIKEKHNHEKFYIDDNFLDDTSHGKVDPRKYKSEEVEDKKEFPDSSKYEKWHKHNEPINYKFNERKYEDSKNYNSKHNDFSSKYNGKYNKNIGSNGKFDKTKHHPNKYPDSKEYDHEDAKVFHHVHKYGDNTEYTNKDENSQSKFQKNIYEKRDKGDRFTDDNFNYKKLNAKKYRNDKSGEHFRKYGDIPKYSHSREEKKQYLKQKHHKENFDQEESLVEPPDHTKLIAMARYVVHQADWTSVATLSTIPDLKGYPFANILSMSDGPVDNSTGVPYFYLTPLDFTSKDLQKDSRCTISVTLEETDYCTKKNIDPEDPRCARVLLSGKMKKMPINTPEYDFAKKSLFTRHPSMEDLPADHHFYIARLKINQIALLDWFGGPKFIGVREYLAYKPETEKVSLIETNDLFDKFTVLNVH